MRDEDRKYFEFLKKIKFSAPILFVCNKIDPKMEDRVRTAKSLPSAADKIYNELRDIFPLILDSEKREECNFYHAISAETALENSVHQRPHRPSFQRV